MTEVATPALRFMQATEADAVEIAALRTAAADDLSARYGHGHWSSSTSEKGVLLGLRTSYVRIARNRQGAVVGTLRLATKKPWAIDVSYFTPCARPLYLVDMAVLPAYQSRGVGRRLLEDATRLARAWPAQAIRLDAYDADAGAGGFYARCGYAERGRVTYRGTPLVYFELVIDGTAEPNR